MGIGNKVKGFFKKVWGGIKKAGSWVWDKVKRVGKGIVNGVKKVGGWIINNPEKAKTLISTVATGVKLAAGAG